MSEITSIDDLLTGTQSSSQPDTPESQFEINQPKSEVDDSHDEPDFEQDTFESEEHDIADDDSEETSSSELDDYGNEKPAPRVYSEDEVNERINKAVRDRLSRGQQQQEPVQQQQQQQQQTFNNDGDSEQAWQQQLEGFVEQTFNKLNQKQLTMRQQQQEQQLQNQFEEKFHQGMGKFADFRDVVGQHHITDAMTLATRAMSDPAAFLYAAAKQNPAELQRIAAIPDQYSQMVEMGRLEERMRKNKAATNAPRPLQKTRQDSTMPASKKERDNDIDDLIRESDNRRQDKFNKSRGRSR